MANPTPAQLSRLRRLIGASIPDGGIDTDTWITDTELTDIWNDNNGDLDKSALECMRVLLANAIKWNDYTAGQTSEKRSQIREGILKAIEWLENRIVTDNQTPRIVGTKSVPPVRRRYPADEFWPAWGDGRRWRRGWD